VPRAFAVDEATLADVVAAAGAGDLVSVGPDGAPLATFVPLLWQRDDAGPGRLLTHLARANPQASALADGQPVLVVVHGPHAYVSPTYYPSAADSGRAVPTWDYVVVQLRGRVRRVDDRGELDAIVRGLTDRFEAGRDPAWSLSVAPPAYLAAQLAGIVGVEVTLEEVTGAAKLSQNRELVDRAAVAAGLAADGAAEAARAVAATLDPATP